MNLRPLLFGGALLLLTAACEDQLVEKPTSFVDPENFYNTAGDATASINAAYSVLSTDSYYPEGIVSINQLASDEATTRLLQEDPGNLDNYRDENNKVNTRHLTLIWQTCYTGIYRANTAIGRIPGIAMDETLRSRLVGEAQFLRALHYFNLVRLFGGVPLITAEILNTNNLDVANSTPEMIYDQIIADLKAAEGKLPLSYSGNDLGRATKGAVSALLAKVYLTRRNWPEAAAKVSQVISQKQYSLLPDYALIWTSTGNNAETVFDAQFAPVAGQSVYALSNYSAPVGSVGLAPTPTGDRNSELLFYASFPDNDARKRVTFLTEYKDAAGKVIPFTQFTVKAPHIKKYLQNSTAIGLNFPVIRYADVLLMAAEAINEVSGPTPEAYQYVNQVRTRAKVDPFTNLTQGQFRDSVLAERRKELAFEGHAWFDAVRTGRLEQLVETSARYNVAYEAKFPNQLFTQPRSVDVKDYHTVFPIPLREIQVNTALKQNPGYGR